MIRLNPQQKAAVDYNGHCVVVACPGSGKTRVLIEKAANILQHDPAASITIVTFTREAAREVRTRLLASAPSTHARAQAHTFHALALRQLWQAEYFEHLLDPGQQQGLLRRAWTHHCTETTWQDFLRAAEARGSGQSLANPSEELERALEHYLSLLEQHSAVDFAEIIVQVVRQMKAGQLPCLPCTHLFVDEFQDVDLLQLEWIFAHTDAGAILTAVGDDDQSIYGFRGALGYRAVRETVDRLSASILPLEINYRSHTEILGLSSRLIRANTHRVTKALSSHNGPGGRTKCLAYHDDLAEATALCSAVSNNPSSWAVIARSNFKLDEMESAIKVAGIPYTRPGKSSFWQQRGPSLLLSILDTLHDPTPLAVGAALAHAGVPEQDLRRILASAAPAPIRSPAHPALTTPGRVSSLRRILNRASAAPANDAITLVCSWLCDNRTKDSASIVSIQSAADTLSRLSGPLPSRVRAVQHPTPHPAKDGVCLITMHGAKGREYPNVWLPGLVDGSIPNKRSDDIAEERRLLYVAMTRAQSTLVMSFPWNICYLLENGAQRRVKATPTRFLTVDIGHHLERPGTDVTRPQMLPPVVLDQHTDRG